MKTNLLLVGVLLFGVLVVLFFSYVQWHKDYAMIDQKMAEEKYQALTYDMLKVNADQKQLITFRAIVDEFPMMVDNAGVVQSNSELRAFPINAPKYGGVGITNIDTLPFLSLVRRYSSHTVWVVAKGSVTIILNRNQRNPEVDPYYNVSVSQIDGYYISEKVLLEHGPKLREK